MTLGATAGCSDLTDGMFTQLVVTGRSRVALYLARIPAGLAIIIPMVAVAFTIICAVCVFSAPSSFDFQGTTVPLGLSLHGYETWAADHPNLIICDFPYNGPCPGNEPEPNTPLSQALAERQAEQNYRHLAGGVDGPGRVENGDQGRLSDAWLDFALHSASSVSDIERHRPPLALEGPVSASIDTQRSDRALRSGAGQW
jgi:hypothetical protein